jgi:hypothetical protein
MAVRRFNLMYPPHPNSRRCSCPARIKSDVQQQKQKFLHMEYEMIKINKLNG